MQETFKIASTDDATMMRMTDRITRQRNHKVEALFTMADLDGIGQINRSEFWKVLENKNVKTWLASMDFVASDADFVFHLSGGDDLIDLHELVRGINDLRGAARSIDMRRLMQVLQA